MCIKNACWPRAQCDINSTHGVTFLIHGVDYDVKHHNLIGSGNHGNRPSPVELGEIQCKLYKIQ